MEIKWFNDYYAQRDFKLLKDEFKNLTLLKVLRNKYIIFKVDRINSNQTLIILAKYVFNTPKRLNYFKIESCTSFDELFNEDLKSQYDDDLYKEIYLEPMYNHIKLLEDSITLSKDEFFDKYQCI